MDDLELDRLQELANVGAGHAADALARMIGRTIRMSLPRLGHAAQGADDRGAIAFDVHGAPGGRLQVHFPPAARRALLAALLGEEGDSEIGRSALCEVGNVLASHALGAVGELTGGRTLPSVPRVQGPVVGHVELGAPLRIETDLVDGDGEVCGRLVWLPQP